MYKSLLITVLGTDTAARIKLSLNHSRDGKTAAFLVVIGTAISIISCSSSVDSSPNLLFFIHFFFVDETWLPMKKFMPRDIYDIHFHIRSNAGIMAGNRDPVNQSGS